MIVMKGQVEVSACTSVEQAFDQFVTAVTCKSILSSFHQLLDITGLLHTDHTNFYLKLKAKLGESWKAQNLWAKLEKRAAHKDYKKGQACSHIRVLIIGSGPCGLRTAIECAFLGAKTVVVEKRDRFSRNNVLHLWPYLITDLRNLGAKKFFGKFCAGAIDHISIRQLQCILLKVALLVGVEVHMNVAFEGLVEPPDDQSSGMGWRCQVSPAKHILSEYEFDVLIGADGKRNTLSGFKRKEFRGKLALAITANFINRNSQAEASVQEISGVAFIFNQKFFMDLKENTRIDLENIVYYKDDTHYFVMTAKKASLLEKGVLKKDLSDTVALLDRSNVDQDALMAYAREAADFSTSYQLPSLDYAVNHYGQADVAMFDFTSMFAAENASKFILKNGHHLLIGLVGDSLLEPFWPTGSGCARGFLSAFDAAWMIRSWAMGKAPLQVLAERESIYTVLSQTTPGYLNKNYNLYSIDPNTRYPNLNLTAVKPSQVMHLYDGGIFDTKNLEEKENVLQAPMKKPRNATSSSDSYNLLQWCQKVLNTGKYSGVHVVDFTSSWHSGLALCALIHSFRPEIIDYSQLVGSDVAATNQLAFSVADSELGIPPVMTGRDMARCVIPDKLTMVSYLAQFYELFRLEPLVSSGQPDVTVQKNVSADVKKARSARSSNRRISFLQKLNSRFARSKKRKEQEENEGRPLRLKKLKEAEEDEIEPAHSSQTGKSPLREIVSQQQLDSAKKDMANKAGEVPGAVSVTAMADILVAKFRSHEGTPVSEPARKLKSQSSFHAASAGSEACYFCDKKVYIMERMSAEGQFFHRGCLKCHHCGMGLRLTNYTCDKDVKPVKFYCYRHALPEMRTRPQRKRTLEDERKKSVPDVVITSAPGSHPRQPFKEKTQMEKSSTDQTALSRASNAAEWTRNTPERAEFEISFDGAEEPEEIQFEHNLRPSLSSELLVSQDSDSESSDSDEDTGEKDGLWVNIKSSNTPETACGLSITRREQHSRDTAINHAARTPQKTDAINMPPKASLNKLEENFSSNVFRDIKDKKSRQDLGRNENIEQILRDKIDRSILKKSLMGLQVSDVDEGRGNCLHGDYVNKDEQINLLQNKTFGQAMKKLLRDTSDTNFLQNSTPENLLLDPSDSGESAMYVEGRLSPSASRTKRFRRKYNPKCTKEGEMPNSKLGTNEKLSCDLISGVSSQDRAAHDLGNTFPGNMGSSPKAGLRVGRGDETKYKGLRTAPSSNAVSRGNKGLLEKASDTKMTFHNVDNRYVTDRHQKLAKNNNSTPEQQGKDNSTKNNAELAPVNSTILSLSVMEDDNNNTYGVSEKPATPTSGHAVYTALAGSVKQPVKTGSTSSLSPLSLTRPLPPPGLKVSSPETHTSLSPSNVRTPKTTTATGFDFSIHSYRESNPDSQEDDVFLTPVECNSESQFADKQTEDSLMPSSKIEEGSKSQQQTNLLVNKMSFNRDKPSASPLHKRHLAETVINNPQTVRSERKILDLPKLNLLTKRPQPSSAENTACQSSKVQAETTTGKYKEQVATTTITTTPTCRTNASTSLDTASTTTNVASSKQILKPAIKQTPTTEVHTNNIRRHKLDFSSNQLTPLKVEPNNKKLVQDDANKEHVYKDISDVSETGDKFYTPCASDRKGKPFWGSELVTSESFHTPSYKLVRPRFTTQTSETSGVKPASSRSFSTSNETTDTTVLSVQQIRETYKADIEKARMQARNRAKLKTDEELGITVVNPSHVLTRHPSVKIDRGTNSVLTNSKENGKPLNETEGGDQLSQHSSDMGSKHSESDVVTTGDPSDINSTQNTKEVTDRNLLMLADKEDKDNTHNTKHISVTPPDNDNSMVSSHNLETEDQLSQPIPGKNKKNKWKTRKLKKEPKDGETQVKDKKMNILKTLIRLAKPPRKGTKDSNVIVSPDSSLNEKDQSPKTRSKDKKSKKKKTAPPTDKTDPPGSLDTTENTEYCKNLAVCSVFHSDITSRQSRLGANPTNTPQTLALGAQDEENSDSNDSYMSLSPMPKRKNDDLETRVARRLYMIQQKKLKQAEQKRLRMAQELQRQLEEVEVRQRDLEDRGIAVEKALRRDTSEGEDEGQLMSEWFTLVHEKNTLLRYESELMVRAKELELEDRQARLERDFRERSKHPENTKTDSDLAAEDKLLEEYLDVVEQRNSLVAMLEEDRLREQKEDNDLKEMMTKKGYVLSPLSFDTCGQEGRQADAVPVLFI